MHGIRKMEAIKVIKAALRKEIKEKLAKLSTEEKQLQSANVVKQVLGLPEYQNSSRISVYLSTDDEIDTTKIIENIFQTGKACFVPRYKGNIMEMVKLYSMKDYNELPLTKWNIKQPSFKDERENALETGGLDLIILPGVAFTKSGDRLGHGKGYYDTFLRKCFEIQKEKKPDTVALAFTEQIVDKIPLHEHDVNIKLVLSAK